MNGSNSSSYFKGEGPSRPSLDENSTCPTCVLGYLAIVKEKISKFVKLLSHPCKLGQPISFLHPIWKLA